MKLRLNKTVIETRSNMNEKAQVIVFSYLPV